MNIIEVIYKPSYAPNIVSYYRLDDSNYKYLQEILEDKFFIEDYIRLFNNSFDYVDNDRIKLNLLIDDKRDIINNFIDNFKNNFDIIGPIIDNYEKKYLETDSSVEITDEDMQDSINLSNLFKTLLKKNNSKDEINKLIIENLEIIFEDDEIIFYIYNKILPYDFNLLKNILKNSNKKIKDKFNENRDKLILKILNIENHDKSYIKFLKEYK